MTITTYASGTQTASIGTEHFLSSPNVDGRFQLHLDLSNMAAGDVLEVRAYKMAIAGGTSRAMWYFPFYGVQPAFSLIALSEWVANSLTDTNAVRFSITQTFGTGRNYDWLVAREADPTVAEIADGVWDELLAGHTTAGSAGKALTDAGTAGDPWNTSLPGAYAAGKAGFILGTNLDVLVSSRLAPTVAARTLDVSAGGEAGVDWANVGSPTTALNLSGTTIKTATDVETDTQDIQNRLPGALTAGGNMKADALAISGDTVAADNAESFFDGTGYAGTNNIIPTVTNVTNRVTANTDQIEGVDATNQIRDSILTDATRFAGANIDVAISSRLASAGYTTPPTVAQIRTEMDTNSTKLDVAVSTRLASASYTTPPTVVQIRTEMDNNSTKLANLDATVSSRSTLTAIQVWQYVLEGALTAERVVRIMFAAMAGKLSGVSTNAPKFRDLADTKNRISATTTADGRTSVTLDGS